MTLSARDLARDGTDAAGEDVRFPEPLVRAVIAELTSPGDVVFDPFAGYGTALVVAHQMGRHAVGIELLPERVAFARRALRGSGRIIIGDARHLADRGLEPVDLCITSPPYMNGVDHPRNPLTGYRTLDGDYQRYLAELDDVFAAVARLLHPGGHLVINAATIRTGDIVTLLAWDIGRMTARHLVFRGETYLLWDRPASWVSGDYCLHFQKAG